MNRSAVPAKRKSFRNPKNTQLSHNPQLCHLSTLPQNIKSIVASIHNLTFSKIQELEFQSDKGFSDNLFMMKSAVEAQELSMQNLNGSLKMEDNIKPYQIKEQQIRQQKWSHRSRRRQSEDILADSKYIQIFNPFHFEEKGDEDFFLVQ